ncbi:hypothetical protein GIB67_034992, partial [Kingdonia uniflora]
MDGETKGAEGSEDKGLGIFRVRKREQNLAEELEEGDSKKFKLFGMDIELRSVFCSSDVRNKYKDSLLLPKWKAFQTVIYVKEDEGLKDSEKIVAFDFDGCLVNTSSEGDGSDAWSLIYLSIPAKLKGKYNNGYKMVIFTNDRFKYNERQAANDSKIGRFNNFINHLSHFADTWKCMNTAKAYNKAVVPNALAVNGCLRAISTLLES